MQAHQTNTNSLNFFVRSCSLQCVMAPDVNLEANKPRRHYPYVGPVRYQLANYDMPLDRCEGIAPNLCCIFKGCALV